MKNKYRKKKRETFLRILLKSEAVALALACVFAVGFQTYIHTAINNQLESQINDNTASQLSNISEMIPKRETDEAVFRDTSTHLSMYTNCYVYLSQLPLFDPQDRHAVQIATPYNKGTHAISVLVDKDGNTVASSRQGLYVFLMFKEKKDEDTDRGFYCCDNEALGIDAVDELYEQYNELFISGLENSADVSLEADSLYINKTDRTFIPHKGRFVIETYKHSGNFVEQGQSFPTEKLIEKRETKEFEIEINDPSFELTTVYQGISGEERPRYAMLFFWGEKREIFDRYESEFTNYNDSWVSYSYKGNADGTATFGRSASVNVNKKNYTLITRYVINYRDPDFVRYFWTYTIIVAALLFIIALLYSWRRNVNNKAEYAMDDYQRDLTNDLAHDIKTPLTAIGGYAENILEGNLSEDEKERYLRSILDNVAFTDSMVSRTLQLNSADSVRFTREKVSVGELLEAAVKKYEIMLDERNITLNISGSASVKADRASLEAVIENLVSNAVKYTSENGTIKAVCDSKRLTVTNTVAGKVDTAKLTQPFVRGDSARSNTQGSGLGLAIADRAAQANGMRLRLSCSDKEFTAELKF